MSEHPIGNDGTPLVMPRYMYDFPTVRPCVLRDDVTGIEIVGQGRPVLDTKTDQTAFIEFTTTWDALPEKTRAALIEQYGKRKARRKWANALINAPVEQVHWTEGGAP